MTPAELQAIRERAERATPFRVLTSTTGGLWHVEVYDDYDDDNTKAHDNADFIAHARTDLPLVVEQLERALRAMEFQVEEFDEGVKILPLRTAAAEIRRALGDGE